MIHHTMSKRFSGNCAKQDIANFRKHFSFVNVDIELLPQGLSRQLFKELHSMSRSSGFETESIEYD